MYDDVIKPSLNSRVFSSGLLTLIFLLFAWCCFMARCPMLDCCRIHPCFSISLALTSSNYVR